MPKAQEPVLEDDEEDIDNDIDIDDEIESSEE